jgi:hypothetical protein
LLFHTRLYDSITSVICSPHIHEIVGFHAPSLLG